MTTTNSGLTAYATTSTARAMRILGNKAEELPEPYDVRFSQRGGHIEVLLLHPFQFTAWSDALHDRAVYVDSHTGTLCGLPVVLRLHGASRDVFAADVEAVAP